jgi:fatty acyl-CoA reductase
MLRANANGVLNLIKFAKSCSQLKGFIHVSSVAPLMTKDKTGEIKEELIEETLVGGLDKELLEVNNEIASIKAKYSLDDNTKLFEELTDLGLERAQEHGFPDTYHYTKALGELIVTKMRGNWPVIIVRPSVIESCLKSPFPGFIEGFKGSEPMFLAYGTGNLRAFPHNESFLWDCMPADILANVCILSTKYALEKKPDIKVFHVCSGMENPLSLRDLKEITFKYFQEKPMKHPVSKKLIKLEEPLQNCTMQEFLQMSEKDKVVKSLLKLTPYVGNQVQQQIFRTDNLQELRRMINKEEAEKFFITIKNISWEAYLYQHIDTCRQLLKGNISNFMLRSKL